MVDLRLNTLTVVKRADLVGRDEPMVWTMFVTLSLPAINARQFVVTTNPVSGKLAKAGKGDTVNIPASVGRFHSDVTGIDRVLMVGLVLMAFDNDLRTNAQIRDGYKAGAAALNQAIIAHFPKHGLAQVQAPEQAEIQAKVRQAILDAVLEHGVVLTLLGGKPLGGTSFTRILTQPNVDEPLKFDLHAKKDRAIYSVQGRLTATN